MLEPGRRLSAPPRPRCARCGDLIGVYERLVLATDGVARMTSVGAEPQLLGTGDACYHGACYELHAVAAPAQRRGRDTAARR